MAKSDVRRGKVETARDQKKIQEKITRCHSGGFGGNLGEILPASLPEIPIQLRDLRNNKNMLKPYFLDICMCLN